MPATFLLLHGYGGTCSEHWQSYLASELKSHGRNVIFPELPDAESPKLENWLAYLRNTLKKTDPGSLVVAAHSLGCSLWLHYMSRYTDVKPAKAFLVAPPLNDCGIKEIADFFPLPDLDLKGQDYLLIGSDNDNFILKEEFEILARRLNIPLKILPGAGHINAPAHGYWEWMNSECLKFI